MIRSRFIERFHTSYSITEDGCWEWQKSYFGSGYPSVQLIENGKKIYGGNRVSHHLFIGPVPEGLVVCHTCDNKKCVNPDHLFIGTQADNMADMVSKDRQGRDGRPFEGGYQRPLSESDSKKGRYKGREAEGNHQAKLNWDAVRDIRHRLATDNPPLARLARQYRVGISTIHRIKHNLSWVE